MKAAACILGCLGVASILVMGSTGQPQNPPQGEDGMEVQARGPVHEAFAQPTIQTQEPSKVIPKKPPEPIEELPPDQKPEGADVQWMPGYWAWDEDREDFLWVSGIWRSPPPDRTWVPGYWEENQGGWRWVSGYWHLETTSVMLTPPPPEPILEAIPPATSVDAVYVPGIWVYRETRFLWRPGHWIVLRPGWVWSPAYYCWTPGGYVFINGCWDHDLHHRGLCFAPVYVDVRVYQRRPWIYRPRHVVHTDFLLTALFVNVHRNHYHFGDYYDAVYTRRGFTPWVDYRVRGPAHDPIFAYYRWQNRTEQRWETNIRNVYITRQKNQDERPPRTLAQQAKGANKVQVVQTLEQTKSTAFKLTALTKTQIAEIQKNTQELRKFSVARSKAETSVKPSTKKDDAPVKIELPKAVVKTQPSKKKAPPDPEPKDKDVPKDGFKDKTPKDGLKDGLKDKTPKDGLKDGFKDKTPKDGLKDGFKDKTPKDGFKDKTPKDGKDGFKDKTPKDGFKDGFKDKKDGFKEKEPKDGPNKVKDKDKEKPKDGAPKEKKEKGKDKDKDKGVLIDRPLVTYVLASLRAPLERLRYPINEMRPRRF